MIYLAGIAAIYASWTAQTWAPAMFEELGVKDRAAAAYCSSVYGFAALPALPLVGAWSDRLARQGRGRKMLIALGLLAFGGLMAAFGCGLDAGAPVPLMVGLLFLIGLVSWGLWAPLFSLVSNLVPPEIRGTTFGLMNAIHFTGAILAPWLTGRIRDVTGSFAPGAYSATALLLLAALLMASVRPAFRWGAEVSGKDS
jgi:MFS family permease